MSNASWWANKMGNGGQQRPSTPPVAPPPPRFPVAVPQSKAPSVPIAYDSVNDQTVTKAQSQALHDRCPECGSDNFFSATRESTTRCFDCGYPLVQSGSGISSVKTEGPVRAARQVSTANNFNPQQIVGRIE